MQAPSGSNRHGWQSVVVTDPKQRAAAQQQIADSGTFLGEHLGEVPVLLVPCIGCGALPAANQAGLWRSILPATWSLCSPPGPAAWAQCGRRSTWPTRRRSHRSVSDTNAL
jgi:nitroreductase